MSHPAFRNYVVEIPGTTVTAYLAQRKERATEWSVALWADEESDSPTCLFDEWIDAKPLNCVSLYKNTPEQVAKVAFALYEFKEKRSIYD